MLNQLVSDTTCLLLTFVISCFFCSCGDGAQVVDLSANTAVRNPHHETGKGPRVVMDAAHANFHTASGRYEPLATLLRNDGFVVEENHILLSDSNAFSNTDIFVIANADYNIDGTSFRHDEIESLQRFVNQGGSLLLIADHTPFPGVVMEPARAFSIHFEDVYADDGELGLFTRDNGGLSEDPLLEGIDQVRTFGGSAFRIDAVQHRPLLVMGERWTMQRMEGNGLSEKSPATGYLQGAVMQVGQGRVAVFGEAAMFSAQVYGKWKTRMGFHARGAKDNKQFILNLFRWLGDGN
jgi:hypothetical protein